MLKDIKPSSISFDFGQLISEIYLCCDEFYPDFDKNDPPEFTYAKNEVSTDVSLAKSNKIPLRHADERGFSLNCRNTGI